MNTSRNGIILVGVGSHLVASGDVGDQPAVEIVRAVATRGSTLARTTA